MGIALLYALCCVFLLRTNRGGGKRGVFPQVQHFPHPLGGARDRPAHLVHSNYDAVVKGESNLLLDSNTILVPLGVLLFAGLYKMAYLSAKDSRLAI